MNILKYDQEAGIIFIICGIIALLLPLILKEENPIDVNLDL